MPIGYLVSMVVPALATAATLARNPRSWTLGQLYWRLSFQLNELPLLIAGWVLAATSLAAAQGDLSTPVGTAGVVLAALTLAGLARASWHGLRTGLVAARALPAGLGSGWRDALAPEVRARLARRRRWARVLFAPMAVRRHDVVRRPDLAYGPAGRHNLLDVYLPRSGRVTGPCLVYFHGGGYRSGRKNREARALIYRLASQGWLCVSANYRLARTAPYPAPLVDAKRVIAWLREHVASFGSDGSQILVAGSSAGAHLAAMTALTPNLASLQPGFEQADTRVFAGVCLYGFYGTPSWIDREPGAPSAPIEQVHHGAAPMLVAHGTHDTFVAVTAARDFVERFRAAAPGSPLVYLELPGAQHTFDLYRSARFDAVVDAVDAFTAHVCSTVGSSRDANR